MLDSIILSYTTFVYFAAFMLYLLAMVMNRDLLARLGTAASLIGLLGQTVGIILRWVLSYQMGIGHAPFSNLYESLVFFAWTLMFLYLIVEWRTKNRTFGPFVTPWRFWPWPMPPSPPTSAATSSR